MKTLSYILVMLLCVGCSIQPTNETIPTTNKNANKEACCNNDSLKETSHSALQSVITCPKCGHKKTETMPTDVCTIKYNCESCGEEMRPKNGDCCVFCTHGTHKCPSMQ